MLDLGLRAHDHAPAAGFVRLAHALITVDNTARRKIRRLDVTQQFGCLDLGIVDISAAGVDHFRKVMRRHIGRHTYRDTRRAVDQQQRHLGRQYRGLKDRLVEVGTEIDRILVDIGHHLVGDLHHAGLGITHGRRGIAVDRTKVTLSVDEPVAQAPLLGHTHHRIVNRQVAVRVELTEHVADDTGRLTVRLVRVEVQLVAHVIENPAVHGFESVPHVRQCTGDDHRHRIVDVGGFHLLLYIDFNNFFSGFFHGFTFI